MSNARKMLPLEVVVSVIEGGFAPLTCAVGVHDGGRRLDVRVFDEYDRFALVARDLPARRIQRKESLTVLLNASRRIVEKKGFKLNACEIAGRS